LEIASGFALAMTVFESFRVTKTDTTFENPYKNEVSAVNFVVESARTVGSLSLLVSDGEQNDQFVLLMRVCSSWAGTHSFEIYKIYGTHLPQGASNIQRRHKKEERLVCAM